MKLFISADIEGCGGVSFAAETHKQESAYKKCAEQMTKEVIAVSAVAHHMGAEKIVIKDGHGDASNIDPISMPEYVTLIRGKSGHPYNMMFGLDETFDAVFYIGYHAAAGNPNFSISHTSTDNSRYIKLNGAYMSEFLLNSYTAAALGVPIVFLSGDRAITQEAKNVIPHICTVETKHGVGGATYSVSPVKVLQELEAGTREAMSKDVGLCRLELPEEFEYEVTYRDWNKAYQMSFYPGMEALDPFTNRLKTKNWLDVVTAHSFVVY